MGGGKTETWTEPRPRLRDGSKRGGTRGSKRGCDPLLHGCLECKVTVVLPQPSPMEMVKTWTLYSSHLVSPKSSVSRAVSLLLSKELARHNNGNQTPNQTCPPSAPSPPSTRPPAAESPMGLVAARLGNHALSLPCPPSPVPPHPCVLHWPWAPLVSALRSRSPRCSA